MKTTIALLVACGLALGACDKSQNNQNSSSKAPSKSAEPVETPADFAESPKATAKGDRSTAEGTVNLFVEAMAKADYEGAMLLVDQTCDGFQEIASAQEAITSSEGKGDETVSLKGLFVIAFTRAWQDVEVEKVGEADGLVQYRFNFARKEPVTIDVRNSTGEWLIIASDKVVVIEAPGEEPAGG